MALLGVVQGLAKREEHLPLLDSLPHQNTSVSRLLSDLAKQCKLVLKRLNSSKGLERYVINGKFVFIYKCIN